jgi:hypothetical protein
MYYGLTALGKLITLADIKSGRAITYRLRGAEEDWSLGCCSSPSQS